MSDQSLSRAEPGNPGQARSRVVPAVLLTILSLVAIATAVALCVEIESLLGFWPALAVAGFVAFAGVFRRDSWLRVLYALSAPMAVAAGSLLISIFSWGPSEAQRPISIMFVAYAIISVLAYPVVLIQRGAEVGLRHEKHGAKVRFSMRTLMIAMTVACPLMAIVSALGWVGQSAIFAAGGIVLGGIALACGWWFHHATSLRQ